MSTSGRVVVAGAGFAGLHCAQSLDEAGLEVLVLEARERVGGRVWSEAPFGEEGGVVERGAEFVLPGYERLTSLLDAHGLALAPMGMSYGAREPRGGRPTTLAAMRRVAEEAGRDAARADGEASVADVLAGVGEELDDPAALAAFRSRFETSAAADAREIAASALVGVASSLSTEESRRVAGGNQLLARRLAASLGDRVLLRRTVAEVRDEGDRVVLAVEEAGGGRGQLDAAACVLALPLPHARDLLRGRRLAPGAARLMDVMGLGVAAKLHLPLVRRPAPSAVFDVPGHWWSWTARDGRDGVAPVAHAFAGTTEALGALQVEEGPATWVVRLRERRPDLELREDEAVLSTWHDDPWSLCAYSHRRPGSAPAPLARAPGARAWARPPESEGASSTVTGRVVLAGEWTAGDWHGLMEGALRSGRRAADETLVLLRADEASRSAAW